jgi:hypothetical protein
MKLLYEPENEIEAQALIGMLASEGIGVVAQRRADTAYPGIGDAAFGWGRLLVAEGDLARAQGLIADYLDSEAEPEQEFGDVVPADSREGPYRSPARAADHRIEAKRGVRSAASVGGVLLFAGSLGLNAYYLLEDRESAPEASIESDARRPTRASDGDAWVPSDGYRARSASPAVEPAGAGVPCAERR